MVLRYGSLESPYHGIRLTGSDKLIDGKCVVNLPEYISTLIRAEGTQVQITNIKHGKVIWIDSIDIENNRFTVKTTSRIAKNTVYEFFWTFTGVRNDVDEIIVEGYM